MTKSKDDRRYHNLLRVTEQFMRGKNFVPLTLRELISKLHIAKENKDIFKKILKELKSKGLTKYSKGKYIPAKANVDIVKGILKLHHRGFGFVCLDDPTLYDQDIFIPKQFTQNAVDGDLVEVEINPLNLSEKGPEGKIVKILERSRTHLAGIIRAIEWRGDIIAYSPLLGVERRVVVELSSDFRLRIGDRIVMEVLDWGTRDTETLCSVTHYLGHISQPACDIPAAIEEFNLKSDFPREALIEARAFGTQVSKKDLKARLDLRELHCVTIDPETAKDFDDALSLEIDSDGCYHLGVHIADVSHYVKPGTCLDAEAKARCNSTYFPGQCIPMLPATLSENLCSLKPNVNRLAVSAMMLFDPNGKLKSFEFKRSVIKSRKRFSYKEAKEVLDGKRKSSHRGLLMRLEALCLLLKKQRYERGSLEFSLPDLVIHVDEKGQPTKTEHVLYDITHQLVEEFMLKANEVVATHLSQQGKDITYRVHEEPSEESMKDFVILAAAFGFDLPNSPTPQDLQTFFDEALQTPFGGFLAISYIRRMRIAMYSPQNIGHYGLCLTHYCHFTSPIRRYIDLVVHRILFGDDLEYANLEAIARQCSEQERVSEKSENTVNLLKKLRYIKSLVDNAPNQQFEAVITRVRNFGVSFEVMDFMLEGFFHVSELEDDFYEYDDNKGLLFGTYTGETFFVGDKVRVMVKEVDLILLQSHWYLVSKRRPKNQQRKKRRRKRQKIKKAE